MLIKDVAIPEVALAVGEGETLASINNAVKYPFRPKMIVQPELATQSYELSQMDGFSDPLTAKDFVNDSFYGDSLGPIGGA